MTFHATKHGRCDCCYQPQVGLEGDDLPLEVTTYDSGGGDMKEQQLCEACTAMGEEEHEEHLRLERRRRAQETIDQIAKLTIIGDMHSVGGIDLPISFFKTDGTLKAPPWDFGGVQIGVLTDALNKTMTFVVPVSSLGRLTERQVGELSQLVEALRGACSQIVPAGWTVQT